MKVRDYSQAIAALSNLSIQYNFSVIAIALALMDNTGDDDGAPPAAYPRTGTQTSALKGVVFAGAITGQLVMGYLGDAIGRNPAMIITNALSFVGALASALCTWGSSTSVYGILIACRFILGVGVGGKYPLAATMRSETTADAHSHISTEVAKGFFWQTPGAIAPYVVGMILLGVFGEENHGANHMDATSIQFRLLLGIGAIPAFLVVILTWYQEPSTPESQEPELGGTVLKKQSSNPFTTAARHPELLRYLLGTGLSWFLYDILYYGVSLVQPKITDEVFGKNETLFQTCWQGVILNSTGLPAVVLAIYMLKPMGSKMLQQYGFLAIVAVCAVLALLLWADGNAGSGSDSSVDHPWVVFGFVCLLIFTLNWGVNVSTYVLPTEAFPPELKSTFFGLSSAAGKFGAVAGGYGFDPLIDSIGFSGMYAICGGLALVGIVLTHFLIEPKGTDSFCAGWNQDHADKYHMLPSPKECNEEPPTQPNQSNP